VESILRSLFFFLVIKLIKIAMKFFTPIFLIILFYGLNTAAQKAQLNTISKRIYTTKKLVEAPLIDGKI
jgi:hypothetical protein